jgi:phosphatidate cytidylyltransferase
VTETSSGSRAGRNLPAAIASSLVLGALVLLSLFTQKWLFVVVVIAALAIASRELVSAFQGAGIRIARTPVYSAAVILPAVAYVWGTTLQLIVLGVSVLLSMLWRIRRGFEGYVKDTAATIFTIVYLPFMAGFLMLTLAADDGPVRVVVFILLTMGNDVGGYAVGVLFGRHQIAKEISPKKSWEGLAGSFVVQAVVGALTFTYLLDAAWWQGVIAGLVLTVTATAGDFAESALKRDLGVKDMGSLLPGHGGMMERLDSLVPNAFASWALFTLFLGSGIST